MVKMSNLAKGVRHLYYTVFKKPSEFRSLVNKPFSKNLLTFQKHSSKTTFNFHPGKEISDYSKAFEEIINGLVFI